MNIIKRTGGALLAAGILLVSLIGCGNQNIQSAPQDTGAQTSAVEAVQDSGAEEALIAATEEEGEQVSSPEASAEDSVLDEEGAYTTKEDVALYLYIYHHLPDNFMTKKEAKELGWTGGSLEPYAPGMCIGGDYFGNYEEVLPEGSYHECDIDTLGMSSRGAKRIVYSEEWEIYYTEDHYDTFELLYEAE